MKSFIALVSGGIDSPVAAYMVGRLGYHIIPLYFDSVPFSSEVNKKRVKECVERLRKHISIGNLIIIPHGEKLLEICRKCERRFTCVLCRRRMFRIAEEYCKKNGAEGIITGEFLGSKASQTLKNMEVISESVTAPIIRPLLGLDKEEIQKIGRSIGTFGQDIIQAGCCSMNPKKPATMAKLERIIEEEKKLGENFLYCKMFKGP